MTPCAVGLERVMGIEPTFKAWEALVLPLNYTRTESFANQNLAHPPLCICALNQYIPFLKFAEKNNLLVLS